MRSSITRSAKEPRAATVAPASVKQKATVRSLTTAAGLVLVLVLSIFAVAPLFYPGHIQTHNGFTAIWNVVDLRTNWPSVGWQPHIALDFDPIRSGGLLPYYAAAILPLPPITAIKVVLGLSWLLGGVGIFLWLRSWLGSPGALIAALVYIYLPHQIVTVYVRGAWGEAMFWGLLPWAMLAATFLVTAPKAALMPIAALIWVGLGFSQLGLAVLGLMFLTGLLLAVHPRQALRPLLSAALGVAAVFLAYFLLTGSDLFQPPATLLADHFLYPFQLFSARWGFGDSRAGWNDNLSLQIGLAAVGLSIVAVTIWQQRADSRDQPVSRTDCRLLFFLSGAVIFTLLQFSFTAVVWNFLGRFAAYPWQLLGFAGLCLAVVAGAALWLDRQLTRPPLLAGIILFIIMSVYPHLLPQFIQPDDDWLDHPQAELGSAQLALLDHQFSVVTPNHAVGLDQGSTTIPLGLHGQLQPDDVLMLDVAWQLLRPFHDDLKVFVHLVDTNNHVLAQFDGRPLQGSYPTSDWTPGEVIADSYPVPLPADAPPGPYQVFLGLYNEASFERLLVAADPEGRIILDVR